MGEIDCKQEEKVSRKGGIFKRDIAFVTNRLSIKNFSMDLL